jgi:Cu-processing system permease protein
MMNAVFVIAQNTFRETVRDKILYSLLVFTVFLFGLALLFGDLTVWEQDKLVTDMGLAAINLVGVIIAIFVGIGLVSKEIDRRTIYTVMARPISRTQFIVGKFCGLTLTLLVNVGIMTVILLVLLWLTHVPVRVSLVQAIQLICVELLIITAIAIFFSTFSSTTLSAIMTLGLYVIGHVTTDLRGIAQKGHSEMVKSMMTGIYYAFPNLELLNVKGQAARGVAIPLAYQLGVSGYGFIYACLLIVAACLVFERRDF